jgi:transcriptional regulator with PAS, ATPase and Fis domain
MTLAEMEQRHVQLVLAAHNGNKTQTAKTLGIDRRSVYRRLQAPSRRFRSKQSERTAR